MLKLSEFLTALFFPGPLGIMVAHFFSEPLGILAIMFYFFDKHAM